MIVQTKKEAWEVVKKMYKTEYHKDVTSSYHEGYPIYTDGRNIFIEDFGVRLNVKKDADKPDKRYEATNIWIIERGEGITKEMEQEAERISDKIVLKPSHIKLRTNQFHKNTIFQIAVQALKKARAASSTEKLFDICDEAENLLEKEIEECDAHLTIYQPLHTVMDKWQKEGKLVRRNYTFIGESEQKTELEIEKKMDMIAEQCSIIADDFERYAEDMRENGAFIYDMSEEYVSRTFAIMQFMDMTRDFMKKGIKIINEIS